MQDDHSQRLSRVELQCLKTKHCSNVTDKLDRSYVSLVFACASFQLQETVDVLRESCPTEQCCVGNTQN